MGDSLPFGAGPLGPDFGGSNFGGAPSRAPRGRGFGFASLAAGLMTLAAGAVGLVLTVVFAATLAVIAVLASVLLALTGLAWRFRRRPAPAGQPVILEARRVGHSWVAYGWDQKSR